MNIILQWIDMIWLVLIPLVAHPHQRKIAVATFLACALMMRMQVELMNSTGFDTGFLPFMKSTAMERGMVVYNFFYMLYTLFAFHLPRSKPAVFMGASITIFFIAFTSSMFIMVL